MSEPMSGRDRILSKAVMVLLDFEGCENQFYLDDKGYTTIGIGELVKTEKAARDLNLVDGKTGAAATPAAISREWKRIHDLGQNPMYPYSASHYRLDPAAVYMPTSLAGVRAIDRIVYEFVPGIVRSVPRFSFLPESVQLVLIDMAWTCGVGKGGLADDFPKMLAHVNAGDFNGAADQCHRITKRKGDGRNKWAEQLLRGAAVQAAS